MRRVRLKPLLLCDDAIRARIRVIRNQPSVRRSMYTDHVICADEHADWLRRLEGDETRIDFAVLADGEVAGAAGVSRLDPRHLTCDWAFYLDEDYRGGLGKALEFAFIDYVFNRLNLEKLNCEVLETNDAVLRLHRMFGFVEEGFRRAQINRDGRRIGVHLLGLTRADWVAGRDKVAATHAATLGRFAVSVDPPA